jgi:hypothetical protein
MRRTEWTYGQLDKALRSLGFSYHLSTKEPPSRVYQHKSGAIVMYPPFPETDFVLDYHLVGARTTADLFGIAEPKEFDAELVRAAGSNGASRPAQARKRRKPAKGQ